MRVRLGRIIRRGDILVSHPSDHVSAEGRRILAILQHRLAEDLRAHLLDSFLGEEREGLGDGVGGDSSARQPKVGHLVNLLWRLEVEVLGRVEGALLGDLCALDQRPGEDLGWACGLFRLGADHCGRPRGWGGCRDEGNWGHFVKINIKVLEKTDWTRDCCCCCYETEQLRVLIDRQRLHHHQHNSGVWTPLSGAPEHERHGTPPVNAYQRVCFPCLQIACVHHDTYRSDRPSRGFDQPDARRMDIRMSLYVSTTTNQTSGDKPDAVLLR